MAPCHFGLETVLKREIYDLGYEITRSEDGHIYYEADEEGIAVSNLCLRTAERVLLVTGRFRASSYEEFFQGIRAIPWERYLTRDARFYVTKATSVKSALFSVTDLQRVGKKAMVERLSGIYHMARFPENGADYPVRIFIYKDEVTVTLDTSGEALHKRGYRQKSGKAPLSETIAAALIMLSPWKGDRILSDPFCGSGTIPIEAAMMAANIAPGLYRSFAAENWIHLIPKEIWRDERKWLSEAVDTGVETRIFGSDIDTEMIRVAKENAARAGVGDLIRFRSADAERFRSRDSYGFIITNPPYGERLSEIEELPEVYGKLKSSFRDLDKWSLFVITGWEDATRILGKPDKNRKVYNGMLKTYLYQYLGPKPGKGVDNGKD